MGRRKKETPAASLTIRRKTKKNHTEKESSPERWDTRRETLDEEAIQRDAPYHREPSWNKEEERKETDTAVESNSTTPSGVCTPQTPTGRHTLKESEEILLFTRSRPFAVEVKPPPSWGFHTRTHAEKQKKRSFSYYFYSVQVPACRARLSTVSAVDASRSRPLLQKHFPAPSSDLPAALVILLQNRD